MPPVRDAKTLGEYLKKRRKESKDSNNPITGHQVADAIKQSQTQVWKLENGHVDVKKWFSERQLALLLAYRLTPAEIKEAAEKFELDITVVHNVGNFTTRSTPDIGTLEEQQVRVLGTQAQRDYPVSITLLRGRAVKDVFVVPTAGAVLACDEVRNKYRGGTFWLHFDRTAAPRDGQIVAYKMRDEDTYILQVYRDEPPVNPVVVRSYDERRAIVMHKDDPPIELLGVRFAAVEDED